MRPFLLAVSILPMTLIALAGQPATPERPGFSRGPLQASQNTNWMKPGVWSITGTWTVNHPNWFDELLIYPDGTFVRAGGTHDGGKWRLDVETGHVVLELTWKSWGTERAAMITSDCFQGRAATGDFELRRIATFISDCPVPPSEVGFQKPFEDPSLQAKLKDSTWRLADGKHFSLHADGLTTGDWHDRKGRWRIIGPEKVQVTIWWRPTAPETVTVENDGTVLRWSDDSGRLAKRKEGEK